MILQERRSCSRADFRVREYNGVFRIQRRKKTYRTTGIFRNKKTVNINWGYVDMYGNFLYTFFGTAGSISNHDQRCKPFNTLKCALERIDMMIEGIKYHYPNK